MSTKRYFWRSKWLWAGMISGLILPVSTISFAESLQAIFMPMRFIVNGVDKTPSNNSYSDNGTSVPASFLYNNTTYIPIHFAANLLEKPLRWDEETKTIYLGQDDRTKNLTEFVPFYIDNEFRLIQNSSSNTKQSYTPTLSLSGKTYKNGILIQSMNDLKRIAFNLNGQYKQFSFTYGFDDNSRNVNPTTAKKEILIYTDGALKWRGDISPGDLPNSNTVSITGVSNLEIQILGTDFTGFSTVDIANPVLTR